jgi:endonuclease YncB( thermonuclease family)
VLYRPELCVTPACLDRTDANYQQIAGGFAWHDKQNEREQSRDDRERYAAAENQARAAKRGLWADPAPVPPWEWRKGKAKK